MPRAPTTALLVAGLAMVLAPGCNDSFECQTGSAGTYVGSILIESKFDEHRVQGFETITGELVVDKTDLENFDSFVCLAKVGTDVTIFGNDQLENIDGLSNLTTIEAGSLTISRNAKLPSVAPFVQIRELELLSISENPQLTSLDGLDALEVIDNSLIIRFNDTLSSINALTGLRIVGDQFDVVGNPQLCESEVNRIGAALEQPPLGGAVETNDDSC